MALINVNEKSYGVKYSQILIITFLIHKRFVPLRSYFWTRLLKRRRY